MEFHITRHARERYAFDQSLFSYNGNIIFANFHNVRMFTQKINEKRDLITFPEQAVKASHLNAMGLIDEIFHHVFSLYKTEKDPEILKSTLQELEKKHGTGKVNSILEVFIAQYPPLAVYTKEITAKDYLVGQTDGIQNRELLVEELILLWIATQNPALDELSELLVDPVLLNDIRFNQLLETIDEHFTKKPGFGPENHSLIEMLRKPAIQVPHSITGQLEYIRDHWSYLLSSYLYRLLTSLDMIKEENKLSFMGPGPIPIPVYDRDEFLKAGGKDFEAEAFSPDRDWMPRLVLLAKNTFVWLDQLSQKYLRPINTLDQIPDEELEILRHRGITGLWLIGLWQRSPASAHIKQLCGNPEAIASAYSLHSYEIASELGGEAAYQNLRSRADRFGIRLASDMVPNHMGIDSEWVMNHPERFLSLDYCPFPSYSFNGTDLSSNPDVAIQIEDHYYDRTDAAVVFRRTDKNTGQSKYIYHGNDGTSMPWNDTAQLNYLDPNVREAVIQTILEVARKFPIIRFDAAMTLAKKHVQRLWFPQPGCGGAIPSRSEYALAQSDFDQAMPLEFWREVVDRIAQEAPDTLLLAEAFWLMEGYFVRTLGMHRVYNSAFMHMLRNEDNAGYRKIIKNTIEFEPEILKRFVNFMNNPDERTAVEQFGKGDKYFGVCTLMATLPGLPMLGHGQIEGFSEKYGMEYRKAYQKESEDQSLISRHEFEIFPLLHRRELFAGVENFWFYDFFTSGGDVNENVYAFSNQAQGKAALVLYNNNMSETEGWIKTSVPQTSRSSSSKKIEKREILNALALERRQTGYLLFRDQTTGLNFLRPMKDVAARGFYFQLKGYEHHVFLDFKFVKSDAWHDYDHLYSIIGLNGIADIDHTLSELQLQPVLQPFREIMNAGYFEYLYENSTHLVNYHPQEVLSEYERKITPFINGITQKINLPDQTEPVKERMVQLLDALIQLPDLKQKLAIPGTKQLDLALSKLTAGIFSSKPRWFALAAWTVLNPIGNLANTDDSADITLAWMDEWSLGKIFEDTLHTFGFFESECYQSILSLRLAIKLHDWYETNKGASASAILTKWFSMPEVQSYVQVNRFNDILWYNRDAFAELLWWMSIIPVLQVQAQKSSNLITTTETLLGTYSTIRKMRLLDKKSEYKVEKLLQKTG